MNYDNIVRFTFTHPDNDGLSIRRIAALIGMNPGSVYRILLRLRLIHPIKKKRGRPRSFSNPLLALIHEILTEDIPVRTTPEGGN